MLKKLAADEVQAQLAVADSKLGGIIRECKSLFKDTKDNSFQQSVWSVSTRRQFTS